MTALFQTDYFIRYTLNFLVRKFMEKNRPNLYSKQTASRRNWFISLTFTFHKLVLMIMWFHRPLSPSYRAIYCK